MGRSLTNVKREKIWSAKERTRLKVLSALLVGCLAAVSSYVVIGSLLREATHDEYRRKAPYGDLSELTDPVNLQEAYLKAHGGLEHLRSLQTLRLDGQMVTGDQKIDFFMLKRRPDMMLMTYKLGREEVTFGSKGGEFWMRQSYPGQPDTVSGVSEMEKTSLAASAALFGPLLTAYLGEGGEVRSIEIENWKGNECLRVEFSAHHEQPSVILFLDPLEMRVVAELNEGDAEQTSVTEYSDFRNIDGIDLPFITVVRVGGHEVSRAVLSAAKFNVGASSLIFGN